MTITLTDSQIDAILNKIWLDTSDFDFTVYFGEYAVKVSGWVEADGYYDWGPDGTGDFIET